jgi:hypothetical protein
MTDKEQQLEQLREAVDRKKEAAEKASHDRPEPAPDETGAPQDAHSPRERGDGKDKMTADRWNQ